MRFGGRRSVLVQSSAVLTNGFCGALRFCDGLRVVRRILAPLVLAAAAVWQPPAAKEGQGDCDFPLGPPWILLYPLKRRRSARGRWRHGLAAARRARGRLALCGVSSPLFGGGRGWPLRGGRGVDIGFAADKRRCFGGGGGWPLRGRRGDDSGFAAAPPFLPRESARGPRPSRASIEPGGVYAGFAAISSEGSLPPGEEIASLQIRRPRPSGAGESV